MLMKKAARQQNADRYIRTTCNDEMCRSLKYKQCPTRHNSIKFLQGAQ